MIPTLRRGTLGAERMTWRHALSRLRDRLLRHPKVQRWAFSLPLIRWVARRQSAALFDLCAGFVYSQVLYAGVELGLYRRLSDGPAAVEELASGLQLPLESARRLLDASVALRLAERRGPQYGLGPLGAALVANPTVGSMVEHHALLYADLADPLALLRSPGRPTHLRGYWAYAEPGAPEALAADRVAAYSTLMAESQSLIADLILDRFPIRGHRRLLDVAGGEGAFLAAAGRRAPELELCLFELPPVAARARARLAAAGLGPRARVVAGDALRDPLPEGADLISLVRVVHDHDDPAVLALLRAARRALVPGGVLLLAEPMARTSGAEPSGDAYFGFYLLAMGQGRPRSPEALMALLREAGFRSPRLIETRHPMLVRLITAHTPH